MKLFKKKAPKTTVKRSKTRPEILKIKSRKTIHNFGNKYPMNTVNAK